MIDPWTKAREMAKTITSWKGFEVVQVEPFIAAVLIEWGDKAVADYTQISEERWRKRFQEADAEGYRRGIEEAISFVACKVETSEQARHIIPKMKSTLLPNERKGERHE